jgi:hypothetical protein
MGREQDSITLYFDKRNARGARERVVRRTRMANQTPSDEMASRVAGQVRFRDIG